MLTRRGLARAAAGLTTIAALGLALPTAASAQSVLRVGITGADVPLTSGQTDSGAEGMRFIGYTVYDALINWVSASEPGQPAAVQPGLATAWRVLEEDPTKWVFDIRQGVQFHDGSPFTAETAVWNLDKILDEDAPQYDPKQALQGRIRVPAIVSYQALDTYTLEVTTDVPNALLPYQISWILMSSPAQWEAVGRDWDAFARSPSGTGPFRLLELVPRERAVLEPFDGYWDPAQVASFDQLVVMPIPESGTRLSALLSDQVDWIEQPAPDALDRLRSSGFQIFTGNPSNNWTYQFSFEEGSPWRDERIRKAANLAIDRDSMRAILNGLLNPASGFVTTASPWFGHPTFEVRYDPDEARRLLAEAGYSPENPLTTKALITSSESAQPRSVAMNEFVQQNLRDVGINLEFEVLEWNTLLAAWRAGARDPQSLGAHAVNIPFGIQDPFQALERYVRSDLVAPIGVNWGYYSDPEMDALLKEASQTFDAAAQDEILARTHEKFVNEALFLFLSHDVMTIAVNERVQGFLHPEELVTRINFAAITLQ